MTLKRNPAYWGRDLAVNRGFWNFDEIRFDFYRESNSQLEAFKRGLYDLRNEHDPGRWQTTYDFPAARDGRVLKEALPTGVPKVSTYFVFNTRRAIFSDIRVREALLLLFDFEWINHSYFFDLYRRTAGYFDGSELSSHDQRKDDGQQPNRRWPEERAPQPDRHHSDQVVRPEHRVQEAAHEAAASAAGMGKGGRASKHDERKCRPDGDCEPRSMCRH